MISSLMLTLNGLEGSNHNMPWVSTVEPLILEAAIRLFGDYGYHGVTTKDLAHEADTTEASIYRLFKSKENLYQQALTIVTSRASEDLGKFFIETYAKEGEIDFPAFVTSAARRWYVSLPRSSARLLQQALIADKKWRDLAYAPIGQMIHTLSAACDREFKKIPGKRKPDARLVVEILIWALFQLKVSRPSVPASKDDKEEIEKAENMVKNWLLCVSPSS